MIPIMFDGTYFNSLLLALCTVIFENFTVSVFHPGIDMASFRVEF